MSVTLHSDVQQAYPDCLRDESRLQGKADSVVFPESESDIAEILARAAAEGMPVTTQGGRTGITGGAVPRGGCVISTDKMKHVSPVVIEPKTNVASIIVQPGATLAELRAAIESEETAKRMFFPPDPTETSAALGGMTACNASGASSFGYGPTRNYVRRLRVALANGAVADLRRGTPATKGRSFSLKGADGSILSVDLPSYSMPRVKNAAGYYAADNMDLMDLFIGSEGTLGVFTEIELLLIPRPAAICGATVFLPSIERVLQFVNAARSLQRRPVAIEFFDHKALQMLQSRKDSNPAFKDLPDLPADYHDAVFLEYHAQNDDQIEEALLAVAGALSECGGSEDNTWIADNDAEMQRLKDFRHAVPEAVNLFIDEQRKRDPELTKLGTDMAVPEQHLAQTMDAYTTALEAEALRYVMFGHIGDNHVHVNILPDNMDQYEQGKKLYSQWAAQVVRMGGTVSAEHGIGKLKVELLREMYGEQGIAEMKAVKTAFDPQSILNRGNLFDS